MKTTFTLLAAALGVAASVCLYFGSSETPWTMQSWSGETLTEERFRRSRRRWTLTGFLVVGLAFVAQAIGVLPP